MLTAHSRHQQSTCMHYIHMSGMCALRTCVYIIVLCVVGDFVFPPYAHLHNPRSYPAILLSHFPLMFSLEEFQKRLVSQPEQQVPLRAGAVSQYYSIINVLFSSKSMFQNFCPDVQGIVSASRQLHIIEGSGSPGDSQNQTYPCSVRGIQEPIEPFPGLLF